MSRTLLKYRGPKNGQAFVKSVKLNHGREVYLGKYESPESYRAYARQLAKFTAMQTPKAEKEVELKPLGCGESRLLVELIERYTAELRKRMTKDGVLKKEYHNVARALVNLDTTPIEDPADPEPDPDRRARILCGDLTANDFDPIHLENLQKALAASGLSRKVINKRTSIIKTFFAWCSKQHATTGARKTLYHELLVVKGLKPGEYGAKECPRILPVPLAIVEKTLPWLGPVTRDMVRVHLLCGMRPAEVCRLTTGEIDRSGQIWFYRPAQHKNAWRLKERMIAIPTLAQQILRPYLRDDAPDAFLFTPEANDSGRRANGLGKRKTKVYPCELRRRAKAKAKRRAEGPLKYRPRYTAETYCQAIKHAIAKAAAAGVTIPPWHPNRLRHASRKAVATALDQKAAQRWLGHENLATTDTYSTFELEELAGIAGEMENHWERTIFARTPGILNPELNSCTNPEQKASSLEDTTTRPDGSRTTSQSSGAA